MSLIAQQTVQDVLNAAAIQDVVASYFPLKKTGATFKALCPFHEEKTPSFTVNPARQIFKCFGCGKGGNVVSFVMEMDKTDFPGAIELLADRYGITVTRTAGGGGDAEEQPALLKIHEVAAQFFRRMLESESTGDRARAYLRERGVTAETVERFGLGYAPAEWDALLKRLRAAGFSERFIRRSGLVVEVEQSDRIYDRFRDRLIFPIRNTRGKTIAFGGRQLPEAEAKGGKYINSPETPIFRKSQTLYGADLLDRHTEEVVVVEGYFDVILPHQHGFKGFVAPMGTAFGPDHARIVRRYARRCTLVFDADAAGQAASERGLDLLLEEDLDIGVAALPAGGKDPADVAAAGGAESLRAAIASASEMFDFLLERVAARRDLSRTAEKTAAASEMLERVGRLEDPVRRDLLLRKISARLDLDVASLRAGLKRPSAPSRAPAAEEPAPRPAADPLQKDACHLIRWMLEQPAAIPHVRERAGDSFGSEEAVRLARAIYALYEESGRADSMELQARMQDAASLALLAEAQMLPPPESDLERDLEIFVKNVQRRERLVRQTELKRKLREAVGEERERIAMELARRSTL